MTHQPDDPGPVADLEVEHGETGTPIPPWTVVVLVALVLAGLVLLARL